MQKLKADATHSLAAWAVALTRYFLYSHVRKTDSDDPTKQTWEKVTKNRAPYEVCRHRGDTLHPELLRTDIATASALLWGVRDL